METYTIGDITQMFRLPASTLRYYEDMGILTNIRRTAAGRRIYERRHINRLRAICCLKRTGMSIAKLQMFFAFEENEAEHIDHILQLLTEQKNQVTTQLAQLHNDLEQVERKLHYYSDMKAALHAENPLPCWSDYRNRRF